VRVLRNLATMHGVKAKSRAFNTGAIACHEAGETACAGTLGVSTSDAVPTCARMCIMQYSAMACPNTPASLVTA
jgi:hypothetical protein